MKSEKKQSVLVVTLTEYANDTNIDPLKLLACIKETFPQAEMATPFSAGELNLAFINYENLHGLKTGAPAAKNSTDGTAPVDSRDFNLH